MTENPFSSFPPDASSGQVPIMWKPVDVSSSFIAPHSPNTVMEQEGDDTPTVTTATHTLPGANIAAAAAAARVRAVFLRLCVLHKL